MADINNMLSKDKGKNIIGFAIILLGIVLFFFNKYLLIVSLLGLAYLLYTKKNDGIMIDHDIVPITMTVEFPDYFNYDDYYDAENTRVANIPFVFFTLDECKEIVTQAGLNSEEIVGVDGFSERLREQINKMDSKSFGRYMDYHTSICKKPELLGASNHLLFVCKK